MRTLVPFALSIGIAAASLAGCGGSQPPIAAPGAAPQSSAIAKRATGTKYKVVYSFEPLPDGGGPVAALINVRGTLYGTTREGGSHSSCDSSSYNPHLGCGTVFSLTTGGTEKVLHSFGARSDGKLPAAALIDVNGSLYGTTREGGSYHTCKRYYYSYPKGCGTVFSITTGGKEKVLHSFGAPGDGRLPVASLIEVKGTLYGTTESGPPGGGYEGTVFSITPSGTEKVVYSFGGYKVGYLPKAPLISVNGTLYGTTQLGGEYYCIGTESCGTVFSITTDGTEKVLHSFTGSDGMFPLASLIDVNGTLYGTTLNGGSSNCNLVGLCGTVFSITPSGTEKVLHSFVGSDGGGPAASLINVKGTLYGTTAYGGSYACGNGTSCGTVFSITPSGKEKVLHSFGNGTDGKYPNASLLDLNGTLYGTTAAGGTYGNGTVFALTP